MQPIWDSYRSTLKKLMKKKPAGDVIPVLDYFPEEKMFLMEPSSLGFFLICQPLPGITANLRGNLSSLFTSRFPANATLVMSLVAHRDLLDIKRNFSEIRYNRMSSADNSFENVLTDIQVSFLNQCITDGPRPEFSRLKARTFEVWVSVSIPIKQQRPTQDEMASAIKLRNEVLSNLSMAGMAPVIADEDTWLRRMQILLNPGEKTQWAEGRTQVKPSVPLRSQVLEPGRHITIDKEGVVLNGNPSRPDENRVVRVLNCYRRPEYLRFGDMYHLYSDWNKCGDAIHEDFMLTLNIHYPGEKSARRKFNAKTSVVTRQEMSGVAKLSSRLRYQFEDMKKIEHELDQDNQRLVNAWVQFNLFMDNNDQTNSRMEDVISFLKARGYGYASDSVAALPLLIETLPLCHSFDPQISSFLNRAEIYTTKALLYLAPVFGPWKGNSADPVFCGLSREGQLVSLDTFQTDASFNIAIAATSGAGKSVLGGNLIKQVITTGIRQAIEDGGQAFVIDAGDSYKGLSSQFASSQYITFGNATCSLDPFANVERVLSDPDMTENDKTDVLVMVGSLLKIMISPSGALTEYQAACVDSIVQNMCVSSPAEATITRFAEICSQSDDERVRDMGVQIGNYTTKGPYGRMFDRNAGLPPVSFDSRLVVCELGDLKNKPDLQTVVLMSIIQQAQDAMFLRKDGRRRMFLVDEGWEWIGGDSADSNNKFFAKFIEAGWRRFRKTRGQGIFITQEISDYYSSSTGQAILANSPWVFCLMQKPDTIVRLKEKKLLSADDTIFDLMTSVQTVKGQFSEILVRYNGIDQVIRLYADDLSMMIHSTDPQDKKLVQSFVDQGHSMQDAIAKAVAHRKQARAAY